MKASQEAADIVYIAPTSCTAKKIHFLAKFYLQYKSFLLSNHGQHQKYKRLIDDEDIALACHQWIQQESGVNGINSFQFKQYIEDVILPEHMDTRKMISLQMAERWLNILDYRFEHYRKGIYFDGHEQEDVVAYRENFLKIIEKLER